MEERAGVGSFYVNDFLYTVYILIEWEGFKVHISRIFFRIWGSEGIPRRYIGIVLLLSDPKFNISLFS